MEIWTASLVIMVTGTTTLTRYLPRRRIRERNHATEERYKSEEIVSGNEVNPVSGFSLQMKSEVDV